MLPAAGILAAAALLVLILSFAVPLTAAFVPAFAAGISGPAQVDSGRIFSVLRFTVLQAVLSALAAMCIGLPAGLLAGSRVFPGRRILLSLSAVPLCVPPIIIALAFVLFFGRQGYFNTAAMQLFNLEKPPFTFLYSLGGVVLAHGFYNFPVIMRSVARVTELLPESPREAARLLGAGRIRIFCTITLPSLLGSVAVSSLLVFLYCFFGFVIVLLFGGAGVTTLEVELYQAAHNLFDFKLASQIGLIETLAAIVFVGLYIAADRHFVRPRREGRRKRSLPPLRGLTEILLAVLLGCFLLVFFIGPLASVVLRSFVTPSGYRISTGFSLDAWKQLLARPAFIPAVIRTVQTAVFVSLLAVSGAIFWALSHRVRRRSGKIEALAACIPLAVSPVLLGFGWIVLSPSGSLLYLVLAQAALAWPFAWSVLHASLSRIPGEIEDAARLLSPSVMDQVWRVYLPLMKRSVYTAFGFVFAISAGDATLPLVLAIPGYENLPLLLYRLVGSYRFAEACACAVVLAFLTASVFAFQDSEA